MKLFRNRFGGLYLFGLVFVALSMLLRTALLIANRANVDLYFLDVAKVYLVGLLMDVVAFAYGMLPMMPLLLLTPDRWFRSKISRWIWAGVYALAVYVVVFDLASEWIFWDEFGVRFNFVAVDYLVYTHEVVGNIVESYPVVKILLALAVAAAAAVALTWRKFMSAFEAPSTFKSRLAPAAAMLLVPAAAWFGMDLSVANVSRNAYNNELAKNGFYSICAAFRNNQIDYETLYLTTGPGRAAVRLRELVKSPNATFANPAGGLDITRTVVNPGPERRCNVIIITVESLSAEFLGCLGSRQKLTPHLDELAGQGLLFTNFYATGTRTDRGLEAITLSVPPTPGRSMVKRPENADLFSLGSIFRARGYDTRFIYGGFGYFDNMNAFFAANSYVTVDRRNLSESEITFSNVWGVCDGDLFARTLKEADALADAGKPFLFQVMTTSNHRPFTYPKAIDIPSGHGRRGGVKYTDYAIDQFIAQAKPKPWFPNTIFMIVADHCASSAGKVAVPVDQYHIPLIVYAPGLVEPGKVDTIASQLDLAPTLLGILKWSYTSKFFGKDVLADPPGRALMGNYQRLALYRDGQATILGPKKTCQTYRVEPGGKQTELPANNPSAVEDTVTFYQLADYMLKNELYGKIDQPK